MFFLRGFVIAFIAAALCGCTGNISKEINDNHKAILKATTPTQANTKKVIFKIPAYLELLLWPKELKYKKSNQSFYTVNARNIALDQFFLILSKQTAQNFVISDEITQSISLSLKNVTLNQILTSLENTYHLQIVKKDYGIEVLPKKLSFRTFQFNYLDITRSGQSSMKGGVATHLAPGGGEDNYPPKPAMTYGNSLGKILLLFSVLIIAQQKLMEQVVAP